VEKRERTIRPQGEVAFRVSDVLGLDSAYEHHVVVSDCTCFGFPCCS
jgi:hypothetical protein